MIKDRFEIVPAWNMTEDEWLQARMSGIGGSEIGAVAGLSKYESPYSIFQRKYNNISTFEGNEATEIGHLLEAPVAERYAKVKNVAVVEWPVILRSLEHPFISANVDRFVVEPSDVFPAGVVTRWESIDEPEGIIGLLECKTGAIASPGRPQDWDDNKIPDSYWCQGVWYGGVLNIPWVDYAALIGGKGFVFRRLEINQEDFQNLVQIGAEFWNNHVLTGIAPTIDGSSSTEESLKALYATPVPNKVLEADDEFVQAWNDFQNKKRIAEAADEERKAARNLVVSLIGDAEVVNVNGVPACSYRKSKDSVGIDRDRLRRERPDIYQEYEKISEGARRLVPSKT